MIRMRNTDPANSFCLTGPKSPTLVCHYCNCGICCSWAAGSVPNGSGSRVSWNTTWSGYTRARRISPAASASSNLPTRRIWKSTRSTCTDYADFLAQNDRTFYKTNVTAIVVNLRYEGTVPFSRQGCYLLYVLPPLTCWLWFLTTVWFYIDDHYIDFYSLWLIALLYATGARTSIPTLD